MIVRILLFSAIFYSIWWITDVILTKIYKISMLNIKDENVYLDVFKCPPYLVRIKMPAPEKIIYLTIFSYYRKEIGFTFNNDQIAEWGGLRVEEVEPAIDWLVEKGYINRVEIDGDRIITLVRWKDIQSNKIDCAFDPNYDPDNDPDKPKRGRGRPKKNPLSL